MRGLPARRIAASALSAVFLLGITGPAATAVERDAAVERAEAASRAPVPGADALLGQVEVLGGLGGVITPVTSMLNTVLKADNGQLSVEQASKFGDAVKAAVAKATAAAPAAPVAPPATTPPTTPGTTTPNTTVPGTTTPDTTTPNTTLPALPTLTRSDNGTGVPPAGVPAGLAGDALDALQKAVDTLLKATTSGEATEVGPSATNVVSRLVDVVAATLVGGGLPAPSLAGLPSLPANSSSQPTGSVPTSGVPSMS
ncbi:hypothetical protein ACWD0J_34080 [Streptomyces sp. NPDC003011]